MLALAEANRCGTLLRVRAAASASTSIRSWLPTDDERTWVHERYVGQLLKGDFRDETRREFSSLVARLRKYERVDAVILGGTELPLLLGGPEIVGVPLLDTTGLHVAAIVERLRQHMSS